jgi:hypothetical protein
MSFWHPYARFAFNWITPTDNVLVSNATEVYISGNAYTLFKQIDIQFGGTIRTYFELHAQAGFTAYGRVYRNGIAVGTERTTTSTTYVAFTEDIANWLIGDFYQIYAHSSGATYTYVRNQQVRGVLSYNSTPACARVVQ